LQTQIFLLFLKNNKIKGGNMFCSDCGVKISDKALSCPKCGCPANGRRSAANQPRFVEFGEAIANFFDGWATFSGRATRAEYWWPFLLNILIGIVPVFGWLWNVVMIVPSIAVGVRRLHDTGHTGLWILWEYMLIAAGVLSFVVVGANSDGGGRLSGFNGAVLAFGGMSLAAAFVLMITVLVFQISQSVPAKNQYGAFKK
jgi:uncharacterized membrane protein YhaH (DUF805 family)